MSKPESSELAVLLDAFGLSPEIEQRLRQTWELLEDAYRSTIDKLITERDELRAKLVELTTTLESKRKLLAKLAEEGQELIAERDALRQRVAELEQHLDDVPCGWTEPVPDYPRKRVQAKSVKAP